MENIQSSSQFHEWLFDTGVKRKINKVIIHTSWTKDLNFGVKNLRIHVLNDLESGLPGIVSIAVDKSNQADWELSLWVVSKLMERLNLEPNNIHIEEECNFNIEDVLGGINEKVKTPYEEISDEDEFPYEEEDITSRYKQHNSEDDY